MRILPVILFAFFLTSQSVAQNLVSGHVDVPHEMTSRVANTVISSMFGTPIGQVNKDGDYHLPVSLTGDVDMLFVKNPQSNEIILLGYGYDGVANIGIEGTALAMLMMFNPINGTLDINGKKNLLQAYKNNAAFPQLLQAVQNTVANQGNVTTPNDQALIKIMAAIQNSTPESQQKSAMYNDPMLLMAH